MKKFFTSIGIFGCILFFICFISSTYIYLYIHKYFDPYKEKKISQVFKASLIIMGDSHPETSLNESFTKATKGGEDLTHTYAKIKGISKSNKNLNTIVLGLSHHSFSDFQSYPDDIYYYYTFYSYPFFEKDSLKFYYNILRKDILTSVILNYKLGIPTKLCIPLLIEENKKLFELPQPITIILSDSSHWEKKIKHFYYSNNKLSPPSVYYTSIVQEIKKLCDANKYKLILYNAPVHPQYFRHIPDIYIKHTDSVVNSLIDNKNIFYLDFSQYPLPDSCFMDSDHTNIYGANIITPIVRDSLISLGVIEE